MNTSLPPSPTPAHPLPAARPAHPLVLLTLLAILLALTLPGWPRALFAAPAAAELPIGCSELMVNGSFEQVNVAWFLPPSLNPAQYDNTLAFAGNFSMRMGNLDAPNAVSSSRAEQTIALPANASSIILSFRYYGQTQDNDLPGADDRQYLDLYDAGTNQFIVRQFEAKNIARAWLGAQYSLTAYRGRTIRLSFGVDNDGQNARLAMHLDEVSLYYCTSTPTPTQTPTLWATPTWTPTFMPTGIPTWPTQVLPTQVWPTSQPGACTSVLQNGGFESNDAWIFGPSPIPGQFINAIRQEGNRAAQLGNPPNFRPDQNSFSSVRQLVMLPTGNTSVSLRWWHFSGTEETPTDWASAGEDRQDLILLNPDLTTLAVLYRARHNESGFVQEITDLTPYRGRSVYIYFNAFNDGNGRRSWMYLDNVQLCADGGIQPYVAPSSAGATGATTYLGGGQMEGTPATLIPDYGPGNGAVATLTPTPTFYANPAPAAVETLVPGPAVQPGEATPDAAAMAQALSDNLAPAATSTALAAAAPATGLGRTGFVAAMCGIVLVIGLLAVGILRTIARPRNPKP